MAPKKEYVHFLLDAPLAEDVLDPYHESTTIVGDDELYNMHLSYELDTLNHPSSDDDDWAEIIDDDASEITIRCTRNSCRCDKPRGHRGACNSLRVVDADPPPRCTRRTRRTPAAAREGARTPAGPPQPEAMEEDLVLDTSTDDDEGEEEEEETVTDPPPPRPVRRSPAAATATAAAREGARHLAGPPRTEVQEEDGDDSSGNDDEQQQQSPAQTHPTPTPTPTPGRVDSEYIVTMHNHIGETVKKQVLMRTIWTQVSTIAPGLTGRSDFEEVFNAVYGRLENGRNIDMHNIDHVVRLTERVVDALFSSG